MSNTHAVRFTRLLVEAATVRPSFTSLHAAARTRMRGESPALALQEPGPPARQQAA